MKEPTIQSYDEWKEENQEGIKQETDPELYDCVCNGGECQCQCGHVHKCDTCHGDPFNVYLYKLYNAEVETYKRRWIEWQNLTADLEAEKNEREKV